MKNKNSIIIIILSILLITSFIINIVLLKNKNKNYNNNNNNDELNSKNSYVGIYHTNNYNNKGIESNLILKDDNTCTFFTNDFSSCFYKEAQKGIEITITNYQVQTKEGVTYGNNDYPTIEECNTILESLKSDNTNNDVELKCQEYSFNHSLITTNSGYLLDNSLLLTKIK